MKNDKAFVRNSGVRKQYASPKMKIVALRHKSSLLEDSNPDHMGTIIVD